MSKVKEFLKEHKKELIICGIGATVGAIGCNAIGRRIHSEDKNLIDLLRSFSKSKEDGTRLVTNMAETIGDSDFIEIHKFSGSAYGPITVREIGDKLTRYYENKGISLDTQVNGLALFETRNQ